MPTRNGHAARRLLIIFRRSGNLERDKFRLREIYDLVRNAKGRDSFAIPYDIQILKAVYAVPDPDRDAAAPGRDLYNRSNAYFTSHDMSKMIAGLDRGSKERLTARIDDITALYADLSAIYQRDKGNKGIPLS